jgi:hypothetical protein
LIVADFDIGGTVFEGRLSQEAIVEVVGYLASKGNAVYQGKSKLTVRIYWRKPSEWASVIYRFVCGSTIRHGATPRFEL